MSGDLVGGDLVGGNSAGTMADNTGRLTQISSRTNLMAIDAILMAIPNGETGWTEAALEAGVVARRMRQVCEDFRASIEE